MSNQQRPVVIEIDPHKIRFNPKNPHKHAGKNFDVLQRSIKEVEIVQLPTVRSIGNGEYECIDGEGRIRSAQEANLPTMFVVNKGIISDASALAMMQAANTARSFSFLEECKGIAELRKNAESYEKIAKQLGSTNVSNIQLMGAIGFIPDDILEPIYKELREVGEDNLRHIGWSKKTFRLLLPLRQRVYGVKFPMGNNTKNNFDEVYDYIEVGAAIKKIVDLEITTSEQLELYCEKRQREIFESRFNQELHNEIEIKLEESKLILKNSYEEQAKELETKTAREYSRTIDRLREQIEETEKKYNRALIDVTKRPEVLEERELELSLKIKELDEEKKKFQELQLQVKREHEKHERDVARSIQKKIEIELERRSQLLEEQNEQAKRDIEAYYSEKNKEAQKRAQLKVERTLQQVVAHATTILGQTQQSILHLSTGDYLKNIHLVPDADIAALVSQMRAVKDTLDNAENKLKNILFYDSTTIESQNSHIIEAQKKKEN